DVLLAHHWIDQPTRNWTEVIRLGNAARPALAIALRDDDPVVRREARWAQETLDRLPEPASVAEPGRPSGLLQHLLRLGSRHGGQPARPSVRPRILILTPVKDAADCLDGYCARLSRLTYPHGLISLGFLESDSRDTTIADLHRRLPRLRRRFRRV